MPVARPDKTDLEALYAAWNGSGRPPLEVFARQKNIAPSTLRRWFKNFLGRANNSALPIEKTFARDIPDAKTYVITSAQNATPIHPGFFASLQQYCKVHDAELVVIPIRYRNPTSIWSDNDTTDDWWAPEVTPHLCDIRHMIGPNLAILADISVQPTASHPLSGFESVSGGESCIIGHPKIAVTVVPAQNHATPKVMYTTGSVTQPNYTHTKAGKKGEFHHSLAAVVVERQGKKFHLRHLCAVDDGSFTDLDTGYTPAGSHPAARALALVMGDVHAQFADRTVLDATFTRQGNLAAMVNPCNFVWHDVLDFYAQNHHHRGEPFLQLAKHKSGLNVVEAEVRRTFALVDKYMQMYPESQHVFPHSNHDAALYRWLKEADWRSDPANAEFYLETALYLARNSRMGVNAPADIPDPFGYWGQRLLSAPERCHFLTSRGTYTIAGVEVGSHGHDGPNGARGTLRGFARLGTKAIIGHSHTPGICEGAMQVGTTSLLRLEYNHGPSSWMQTHGLLYANGKRTLINFIDGEFTARKPKAGP